MTKEQADERERVFEQAEDERGRIRLDRPFTAEEAAAQDAQNRERFLAERRNRFGPARGR